MAERITAEWHHGESGPVLRETWPDTDQYTETEPVLSKSVQRRLAHQLPTWTAEPPTEPGWYWCMDEGSYGSMESVLLGYGADASVLAVWSVAMMEWVPVQNFTHGLLWHPVPLLPPDTPDV